MFKLRDLIAVVAGVSLLFAAGPAPPADQGPWFSIVTA